MVSQHVKLSPLNITEMKDYNKVIINSPKKRAGVTNIAVTAVLSLAIIIIIIVALSATSPTTTAFAAATTTTTTTTQNNQNVPSSYNNPQSKGINQGGGLTHQSVVKEPVAQQQGSVLKFIESSFVQGVKITEAKTTKSPDIVSIKLAQVVQGNTTTTNNKSSTKVGGKHTPDITLVALTDQTQGNGKVADSTIVKGGWSDSKTIDMKIAGIDFTKGTPMIRVLAVPLTSSSKQV
jgi:hypothetical protein